ncbi:hypothetical protein R70006_06071 [Paraburkholderia domus]|nr:hypothetical protein R70006_06071 [Paraburkholderia domus]
MRLLELPTDALQFVKLSRHFLAPRCACPELRFERDARLIQLPTDALQFAKLIRRFLAPRRACLAFRCERSTRLIQLSLQRGDPRKALARLRHSSVCTRRRRAGFLRPPLRFGRLRLLDFCDTLLQRPSTLFCGLGPLLRGRRVVRDPGQFSARDRRILRNLSQLSAHSRFRLSHSADLLPRRLQFTADALQFIKLNRCFFTARRIRLALCFERKARLVPFSLRRRNPRKALVRLRRRGFCAR